MNVMTLILAFLLQRGPVEGVLFTDYGTDLGSGNTVPGTVQTRLSVLLPYASYDMLVKVLESLTSDHHLC